MSVLSIELVHDFIYFGIVPYVIVEKVYRLYYFFIRALKMPHTLTNMRHF